MCDATGKNVSRVPKTAPAGARATKKALPAGARANKDEIGNTGTPPEPEYGHKGGMTFLEKACGCFVLVVIVIGLAIWLAL